MITEHNRAHYGFDGGFIGVSFFAAVLASLATLHAWAHRHDRRFIARATALGALAVAGSATSFLYSTGPGKRALWSELLDDLGLNGDQHILDIGCGRGAVLMLAARHLSTGRAVGCDIWRLRDQNGSTRSTTERNARCEGVSDRVQVVDADARDLPFPPETFDVVVSSLCISNIADADGRTKALREAVRVLRAGGRLRIVDDGASSYSEALREAGCDDVRVSETDWRTWYGIPGHHMDLISATKRPAP